jgi:Flp pilus assembly pilin Flp
MKYNEMKRRRHHGQGLVEYALVLVLVALVVIAIVFTVGLGVQRVYGVVAGALGVSHTKAELMLDSPGARCYLYDGTTNIYLTGSTNIPFSELTFSTNTTYNSGSGGGVTPIRASVPGTTTGTFWVGYQLAPVQDRGLCPTSVVIQSSNGAIAISPVTIVEA